LQKVQNLLLGRKLDHFLGFLGLGHDSF
jgi:hypothetical protein